MLVKAFREGQRAQVAPSLEIVVLEIQDGKVKLGCLEPLAASWSGYSPARSSSSIAGRCPGYYCFPQGGRRMFVLHCQEGQSLRVEEDTHIAILRTDRREVQLACWQSRAAGRWTWELSGVATGTQVTEPGPAGLPSSGMAALLHPVPGQ